MLSLMSDVPSAAAADQHHRITTILSLLPPAQKEKLEGNDSLFPPHTFEGILGYTIGIFSAIMYLGSRMPQIYKNVRHLPTNNLLCKTSFRILTSD